jgi:glucose/arabinose dehydrogenase
MKSHALLLLTALPMLAACGETATLPWTAGTGPNPQLPSPHKTLLPTMQTAKAVGWAEGGMPTAATGLKVNALATGLDHPRWLYVLPNGDVLVAETNAPPKPDDGKGIRGFVMGLVMKGAGAAVPSPDRITLLRDADGDGVAEVKSRFLEGRNAPFGIALVGNALYIADSDKLMRFPYQTGQMQISDPGTKVLDLPAGTINHHWTKNVIASGDGQMLYVTVGSNSNVGENGMAAEEGRAAIWQVNPATGQHRVFASGLRNPNGMAWAPDGALWAAVNERDEIGSDLVPDYITSVKDGAFYGWPYSYYGQHVDARVKPQRPDMVAKAVAPDYALGPHTASLGLTFSAVNALTPAYRSGAFIGQHGSWNRNPKSGYKVIYVPFNGAKPTGPPQDVLTGFLSPDTKKAMGRPVGVAINPSGDLLVADDVGNVVWRVSAR